MLRRITATGAAGPVTVTGLANGQHYTVTVYATNGTGNGPASDPSNPVTPAPAGMPSPPQGPGATASPFGPGPSQDLCPAGEAGSTVICGPYSAGLTLYIKFDGGKKNQPRRATAPPAGWGPSSRRESEPVTRATCPASCPLTGTTRPCRVPAAAPSSACATVPFIILRSSIATLSAA